MKRAAGREREVRNDETMRLRLEFTVVKLRQRNRSSFYRSTFFSVITMDGKETRFLKSGKIAEMAEE